MKKITFILLLFSLTCIGQEIKDQKIDLSFSYGLSYNDLSNISKNSPLNTEIPKYGSFYEINLDYKFPKNRYFGIGYSRVQHAKNINTERFISISNFGIIMENYRNIYQKNYVDLHFRRVFQNNIQFTIGVFYYVEHLNVNRLSSDETNVYLILNSENRIDNVGLFGSLEYYFKLTDYADIGMKGKLYYSLIGIDNLAILPTLRVKF